MWFTSFLENVGPLLFRKKKRKTRICPISGSVSDLRRQHGSAHNNFLWRERNIVSCLTTIFCTIQIAVLPIVSFVPQGKIFLTKHIKLYYLQHLKYKNNTNNCKHMYSHKKFNLCLVTEDTLKFSLSVSMVAMAIEKGVSFKDALKF